MADGNLNVSFQPPTAIVLDRFSGVFDPTVWVYQAECYLNFHEFSKDMWLSLPCLYFDGEALGWFNWLYRNKQFHDWKHFTDKLFYHYRRQTVTKFGLPSVSDLLLQIDVNLSRMHRHLDNIHNTLSACSQKFYDAPAQSYLTASLADKCDIEEVVEQEFVSSLDKDNSNPTENSEVTHTIETLGPMLESKNDLKDDPINYACKMFAEMPNKKIAMKVEHTVINDSENLASHMFDEMFQTISAVKGEDNDLIMFNMQLGLGIAFCSEEISGMLSTCTYVQLINRVNVEALQLQGCSGRYCLIAYSNSMTRVWDPGQSWCVNSSILQYDSALSVALSSNYTHFYIVERSLSFYLTTLASKVTGLTWRGNVLVFLLAWHAENKA
ncbi:hypothetical protein KY290_010188 [Solanum tuberosum]|uniref:Retrotransposon gag domain-containing protein n=1 Tax=Solanum tuberosum TaxID=4113 RepID=A0ABQ7VX22_SOLTU|nr:hypothetical protein KY289_010572 [Solanum tuberosum]KAH0773051.1 hypothetical protein KY290_010188 [Solanum tuberosum]